MGSDFKAHCYTEEYDTACYAYGAWDDNACPSYLVHILSLGNERGWSGQSLSCTVKTMLITGTVIIIFVFPEENSEGRRF